MRPALWHPTVELSAVEQGMVARMRRATLFIFLCRLRHELFGDACHEEWGTLCRDSPNGLPPVLLHHWPW
jgi:hypothetical protein